MMTRVATEGSLPPPPPLSSPPAAAPWPSLPFRGTAATREVSVACSLGLRLGLKLGQELGREHGRG